MRVVELAVMFKGAAKKFYPVSFPDHETPLPAQMCSSGTMVPDLAVEVLLLMG